MKCRCFKSKAQRIFFLKEEQNDQILKMLN